MKEELCRAFCDNLTVNEVPAGLAVSTAFVGADGDKIGFYVVRNSSTGLLRIEDDGMTLTYLEGSGVDFSSGTRNEAMLELLDEYEVEIDDDTQEFFIGRLLESDLPDAALRFVAFSLRVRDFMLMTEYRVATTFREDAARLLKEGLLDRATIEENKPLSPKLADFTPDFVLRAKGRPPVAVFLGTSEARVLEAIILQMRATHEINEPCSIIALLERSKSISTKTRQQAANRLAAVPEFRGDEIASIGRIVNETLGTTRPTIQ